MEGRVRGKVLGDRVRLSRYVDGTGGEGIISCADRRLAAAAVAAAAARNGGGDSTVRTHGLMGDIGGLQHGAWATPLFTTARGDELERELFAGIMLLKRIKRTWARDT